MKPGAGKRILILVFVVLASLLAVLLLGPAILAQSGGAYDLNWSAIGGGGQTGIIGSGYLLGSTIGQPGAGTATGGQYILESGFWHCFPFGSPGCGETTIAPKIYIPVIANPNE